VPLMLHLLHWPPNTARTRSTPSLTPPSKSPCLNLGAMVLRMMSSDRASVKRALQAVTHSIRSLCSATSTISKATGVLALLPDAPVAAELVTPVFDGISVQGLDGDHHQLVAALLVVAVSRSGEELAGVGIQDACLVHHGFR